MPDEGLLSSRAQRGTFRTNAHLYVYILTNVKRNVMYVSVTNNLENRIAEHRDLKSDLG